MKVKKCLILGALVICFFCFQSIQAQQNGKKLAQIKTIFVAPTDLSERVNNFSEVLKIELKQKGFIVEEDKEKADAILLLKDLKIEITLHGTRDDIPKFFYEFELHMQNGEVIWKKEAKFLTKDNQEENDQFASKKIAEILYYDRIKAQKKNKSSKEK